MLYGAGLRRAEAAALDVDDIDRETGALTVRCGKGRKDRVTYLTNGAHKAVIAWIEHRGGDDGPLFVPVRKDGVATFRRMTSQSVYMRLTRHSRKAGVDTFSPHDLRRSYCSDLLDAGADVSLVQRLMGHANVSTTQRYDRRPEQSKQRAAALLHVPYVH